MFEAGNTKELAAAPAVLISENYWRKRFNGDAGIVGETVKLNGVAFTIMGVTPHNFVGTFVAAPDFGMPMEPGSRWCIPATTGW